MKQFRIRNRISYTDLLFSAAKGDIGTTIGAVKFYDLQNAISSACFAYKQAKVEKENGNFERELFYLRAAILDYNACYDYVGQIAYFCFDFFDKLDSKEELSECIRKISIDDKHRFMNQFRKLSTQDTEAKVFFKKFQDFLEYNVPEKNKDNIRIWANTIKHRGGFVTKDILSSRPVASIRTDKDFTLDWLYEDTPTSQEVYDRLEKHNGHIVDYAEELLTYVFKGTEVFESESHKPFSCNKPSNRFNAVFLTEFKDKEYE